MAIDRGGRNDYRQRRAFQKLSQNVVEALVGAGGDGIEVVPEDGVLNVDLASGGGLAFMGGEVTVDLRDTTPGLELVSSGLGVIVGNGLELTATGVEVDLASNPGLAFDTGDLTVDLRDTTPGLELVASGIGVIVGSGLELTGSGVEVDLATDPGLEFDSGDLRVKVKTDGGLVRDSDGLSLEQIQESGTYTPTITAQVNVSGATANVTSWFRNGDQVTVSGNCDVNPTAADTDTAISLTLPVATANFTDAGQAGGVGVFRQNIAQGRNVPAEVVALPSSQEVFIAWGTTATSERRLSFIFSYTIQS